MEPFLERLDKKMKERDALYKAKTVCLQVIHQHVGEFNSSKTIQAIDQEFGRLIQALENSIAEMIIEFGSGLIFDSTD